VAFKKSPTSLSSKQPQRVKIDVAPEKKASAASYKKTITEVNKRLAAQEDEAYCQFDRLKIGLCLRSYDKLVEFKLIDHNMNVVDNPELPPILRDRHERLEKLYRRKELEGLEHNKFIMVEADPDFTEVYSELGEDGYFHIPPHEPQEIEDEELNRRLRWCVGTNGYPNCKIDHKIWSETVGLTNLFIKNDFLAMDISGKFMASDGFLGHIDIHNIEEVLRKILRLNVVEFNIEEFLKVAQVFICDHVVDIEEGDQQECLAALNSLTPLDTRTRTIRYSSGIRMIDETTDVSDAASSEDKTVKAVTGLTIPKKSRNSGSCLTIYSKGVEIDDGRRKNNKQHKRYKKIIGDKGLELARKTLRFESHMHELREIRRLLNIPMKQHGVVLLEDVLSSTEKVILKQLEKFGVSEEVLKERIFGYIKEEEKNKTPISTARQLKDRIAEQRVATLINEHDGDIRKVKDMLSVELEIDATTLITGMVSCIKGWYFDFIVCQKPKTIRAALGLLDKVHAAYGRRRGQG